MPPVRIAMWSGPRNISTALMRSWGSRPDTAVTDEPLYGHYLRARPEVDHPGREEVVASMDCNWRSIASTLTGPVPGGKPIWYQKHMAHHLTPDVDRAWVVGPAATAAGEPLAGPALFNCLLIRDPREVLISLAKVMPRPDVVDTGLPQQLELFHLISRTAGTPPPILDARDILLDPPRMLRALCAAAGVPFLPSMLSWAPGPRPEDGIWAKHWYAAVEKSTGFEPYRERDEPLPAHLADVHARCLIIYDQLCRHRIP